MLNLKALNKAKEKLESGGDSNYFMLDKNHIDKPVDIRILPPTKSMNGIPYIVDKGIWLNGKRYTSYSSFNEDCPLEEEIKEAKSLNDPDVNSLLTNGKTFNWKNYYNMPILVLDCKFKGNKLKSFDIVDNQSKIFKAPKTLLQAIVNLITSRDMANGTPNGMLDRVEGHNVIVTRKGVDLNTEYIATPWIKPTEIEKKYFKNYIDPVEELKKTLLPKSELRAIIRNYLYGEDLPKSMEKKDKKKDKKKNKKKKRLADKL